MILYEKCAYCALFVEDDNGQYHHLSRGDDADDAIEASHDATPSGLIATLATWRTIGPPDVRARFVDEINT